MSVTDDGRHRGAGDNQAAKPAHRRNRHLAVGAAGAAALLSAGAYFALSQTTDEATNKADGGAVTPVVATSLPSGRASALPSPSGSDWIRPVPPATAAASAPEHSLAPEVQQKIDQARKKMAEDGVPIKRPVQPRSTAEPKELTTTTEGSLKGGGIVRIVTARSDLTGQGELAQVAGGVTSYRGVPCSQTFRFSVNMAPAKKPNLLMCWRTTTDKSVFAVVVDPNGEPSRQKAVDVIQSKWRAMK